jgi:endonuclease/exonuclease/phosphatase family metal-dependent hydrolase
MAFFDVSGRLVNSGITLSGDAVVTGFDVNGGVINAGNEGNNLVVMSYNIQRWTKINADEEIVSSIFDKYNPDIVGFQEYQPSKTLGGTDIGTYLQNRWAYLEVGDTKINDYTKAVSSRLELKDATTVYYTVYSESRSYQKMYVEYGGKRIALFHTHLDFDYQGSPTTPKCKQIKELFDAVANEEYFIAFGDFNTCCTSTADADYINMMKQFVDAGYHCANCSDQHGFFNTWTDGTTLTDGLWEQTDNVITSANILIDKVVIDTTKADANTGMVIDHFPLVAYLTIT